MARTLIASDDFNRTSGPGSNWANLNSDWGGLTLTTATKLYSAFQTPNPVRAAIYRWVGAGTFTANQASSVTIQGLATEGGTNLNWGASVLNSADINGGQDRYEAKVFDDDLSAPGGRTTTLYKIVNGVATSLHSADVTWNNGDLLELEHEDGVLRVCKNGTPLGGSFTYDDSGSSPLTSGAPGLTQAGGGDALGYISAWAGYNITSGGSFKAAWLPRNQSSIGSR